jgi:hypothetical protein
LRSFLYKADHRFLTELSSAVPEFKAEKILLGIARRGENTNAHVISDEKLEGKRQFERPRSR